VRTVWEVEDYGRYREMVKWNPLSDEYEVVGDSYLLTLLSLRTGKSVEELKQDIEDRREFLENLRERGVRSFDEVSRAVGEFYRLKGAAEAAEAKPKAAEARAPRSLREEVLDALRREGRALDLKSLAHLVGAKPVELFLVLRQLQREGLVKSVTIKVGKTALVGFELSKGRGEGAEDSELEERVIELLRGGPRSRREIEEELGVDSLKIVLTLARLRRSGRIRTASVGGETVYELQERG